MSLRVCTQPECPALIKAGTRDGRCAKHRRAFERARGSATSRGYGVAHQRIRAAWQARIDGGEAVYCWRCRERGVLTRLAGRSWQLGHDDNDRSKYRGPECVPCNTATAGRRDKTPGYITGRIPTHRAGASRTLPGTAGEACRCFDDQSTSTHLVCEIRAVGA